MLRYKGQKQELLSKLLRLNRRLGYIRPEDELQSEYRKSSVKDLQAIVAKYDGIAARRRTTDLPTPSTAIYVCPEVRVDIRSIRRSVSEKVQEAGITSPKSIKDMTQEELESLGTRAYRTIMNRNP